MTETLAEYKKRLGRAGGLGVVKKLGREHMAENGRRGMAKRWANHVKKNAILKKNSS